MAKKPRTWLSKQPRWAQALYRRITTAPRPEQKPLYSPRTAREKVREFVEAPARDFKVGADGVRAFLKGGRSKHPLTISERQLRIKRSGGITPEAQAAGAVRPESAYKRGEAGRIAADRQRKAKAKAFLSGHAVADEQKVKADALTHVTSWKGHTYEATEANRAMYEDSRRRWLSGEELSWSEWHNLCDFAAATNDPIQRVLRTSPKTRVQKLRVLAA